MQNAGGVLRTLDVDSVYIRRAMITMVHMPGNSKNNAAVVKIALYSQIWGLGKRREMSQGLKSNNNLRTMLHFCTSWKTVRRTMIRIVEMVKNGKLTISQQPFSLVRIWKRKSAGCKYTWYHQEQFSDDRWTALTTPASLWLSRGNKFYLRMVVRLVFDTDRTHGRDNSLGPTSRVLPTNRF
jgi:hypothetical protein